MWEKKGSRVSKRPGNVWALWKWWIHMWRDTFQVFCIVSRENEPDDIFCVSIQGLHPSEEHLKANYIITS